MVQLFQAPKKEFSCLKKLYPRDISGGANVLYLVDR